ncbi:MAG: hypothetical protein AAF802_20085 [Planctomycetota bacterium]
MVFTLRPFGHTLALWQRAMTLVQFLVVQASLASFWGGVVKTFRWATQTNQMDTLVSRINNALCFRRPDCVVIHAGDDCFDCPDVAEILHGTDCASTMKSVGRFFSTFPMDCMSADAFLHYLPAIARESFGTDGLPVAQTVVWILGADEWDTDLTISQQIKPQLSSQQIGLIRELLDAFGNLSFSDHASGQLAAAIKWWGE